MSTVHGNDGKVYSDTNQVGHVQTWSYDEVCDMVDGSGMGDTSREWYAGIQDGSGSVTLNWDPDDTGIGDIVIGATLTLKLYPEGNVSGDTYWSGSAIVESVNRAGAKEGAMVTLTFGFRGKLTEGTVT